MTREYLHLVWVVPAAAALVLASFVLSGLYVCLFREQWRRA